MKVLIWMLLFKYIESYENLCRRQTGMITQSSTFSNQSAFKAKDADYSSCAVTDFNQSKAWLQVDLGRAYMIDSVKIYFRSQGDRKRPINLDVSNWPVTEITPSKRTRCFIDNTKAPDLLLALCQQNAMFVIVETTYDAPEDGHTGAVLEICEIEVYGQEIEGAPVFTIVIFVFFSFSLLLNLIFVIWVCRKKMCRCQKEPSETSTGYVTNESVPSAVVDSSGSLPPYDVLQYDTTYLELI